MAEDPRQAPEDPEPPPSTPFDSPWFLPVLLWLFAGWFGFDIVTDAKAYQDYPWFNRGGLVVTGGLALWFTLRAVREQRSEPDAGPDGPARE